MATATAASSSPLQNPYLLSNLLTANPLQTLSPNLLLGLPLQNSYVPPQALNPYSAGDGATNFNLSPYAQPIPLSMGQMNQFQYPLSNQVQQLNLSPNAYFGANDSPNPYTAAPSNDAMGLNANALNGNDAFSRHQTMNNMELNMGHSPYHHQMDIASGTNTGFQPHGHHQLGGQGVDVRGRFEAHHQHGHGQGGDGGKPPTNRSKRDRFQRKKRKGGSKRDGRDSRGSGHESERPLGRPRTAKQSNKGQQGQGRGGRGAPSAGLSKVSLYGDGAAKRQLISYIDDYLVGGAQMAEVRMADIVALHCKDLRAWSSIINETLRDRAEGEVSAFVGLVVRLFRARVLDNRENAFQEKVVKYLALECDDSSAVCPRFAERVALFLATLAKERCLAASTAFPFFKKMYREYSEWSKKRQNKLFAVFKESAVQEMQRMGARPKDVQKVKKM